MTAFARNLKMGAVEEEPGLLMDLEPVDVTKRGWDMTPAAVGAEGPAVDVQVAGSAGLQRSRGLGEPKGFVAGSAAGILVPPGQREACGLAVLERRVLEDRTPPIHGMTVHAAYSLREGPVR